MANEQTDENGSDLNLTPVPDFDLAGVSLMKRIRESDVFFYPACEFDWSPMLEYTHRCNLFIYCDWGVNRNRFDGVVKHVPIHIDGQQGQHTLWFFGNREINDADMFDMNTANAFRHVPADVEHEFHDVFAGRENEARQKAPVRWGRIFEASHSFNGTQQHFLFAYLSIEGVTAYQGFFTDQRRAPKVLCINNCGDGFGGNYTAFHHRNKPLEYEVRHAIENKGAAPEIVLCDRDFNWPDYVPDGPGRYLRQMK